MYPVLQGYPATVFPLVRGGEVNALIMYPACPYYLRTAHSKGSTVFDSELNKVIQADQRFVLLYYGGKIL